MGIELDHVILAVNDGARSIRFYTEVLGLGHEGEDGPFSILRVTPGLVILLSPSRTQGGEHLAFAMSRQEFEGVFARLKRRHCLRQQLRHGRQHERTGRRDRRSRNGRSTLFLRSRQTPHRNPALRSAMIVDQAHIGRVTPSKRGHAGGVHTIAAARRTQAGYGSRLFLLCSETALCWVDGIRIANHRRSARLRGRGALSNASGRYRARDARAVR